MYKIVRSVYLSMNQSDMYIYLIYLFIYLILCLSSFICKDGWHVCLPIWLTMFICVSISLSLCIFLYLYIYIYIYVSVFLSVYLSVNQAIYLFICRCAVCLSIYAINSQKLKEIWALKDTDCFNTHNDRRSVLYIRLAFKS